MNYLTHELSLLQAASQGIDGMVAQLNAAATQQDQAASRADNPAVAAVAAAAAAHLRQQAAQTALLKNPITQQTTAITTWQTAIAIEPADRATLEAASRDIAAAIATIESQYASALDAAAAAEKRQWYLWTLTGELTMKIGDIDGQLPAAAAEIASAQAAAADIQGRMHRVLHRKPE